VSELRVWDGVFKVVGEVLEKVVGGWVKLEGLRGVWRYPVWYISGIRWAQKQGQDSVQNCHRARFHRQFLLFILS